MISQNIYPYNSILQLFAAYPKGTVSLKSQEQQRKTAGSEGLGKKGASYLIRVSSLNHRPICPSTLIHRKAPMAATNSQERGQISPFKT